MEALLFLGLAAIVIVGAFTLFNNASSTTKMNQAKTQLQSYIGGAKSLFTAHSDYSGLTTLLAINAGLAPNEAVDEDVLVNPWGGATDVVVHPSEPRQFMVIFHDVPREACTALLSASLVAQGTVIEMGANGTTSLTDIAPAAALGMCNSDAANRVEFIAR